MLKEDVGCAEAVYDIVQRFINNIGIPTIQRYERCAKNGWKLLTSTECPPPFSEHGIFPRAWPPNSSRFNYYGKKSVIIDDNDNDNDILTPSQHQFISFLENEGYLKQELMLAKDRIGKIQTDLADSRRREQDLLVQIEHLTNARAATPNRHRTLTFSQKSQQVQNVSSRASPVAEVPTQPTEYGMFFEAHDLDDKHLTNAVAPPATPSRRRTPTFIQKSPVHSHLRHKTFSPAPTASATMEYGTFIDTHGLDDIFPAIDIIRRKVAMYLWRDKLLNAGVPEELLTELMEVMCSFSPFV